MSKRMSGSKITDEINPTTELISRTENPIGTLFAVWHNSRNSRKVKANDIETLYRDYKSIFKDKYLNNSYNRELIDYIIETYPEYLTGNESHVYEEFHNIVKELVKLIIKCDVPASEFVSFEFCIDAANIAWREQLVRARKLHIWMQTSRTADLRYFDATRMHNIELRGGDEAVKIYDEAIEYIREVYEKLVQLGVPVEDIRLTPQTMLHRVQFGVDLRNLLKLIGKRASWIAQASLWAPITADIISILRDSYGSEIIDDFVGICEDITYHKNDNGEVIIDSYKYINENDDRYYGKDPQPIDPLYAIFTGRTMPENTDIEFYDYMKSMYIKMWNDDILSILGWDRDHPEKLSRIDRPESYWNKINN
jgi:hypothetical protein